MKKKKEVNSLINLDEMEDLQKDYIIEIENNPKYSLQVDPENLYNFSDKKKEFIKQYVQFKNLPLAAEVCDLDPAMAKKFFSEYGVQNEIRRINLALYQRQFASKLLTLDDLGRYLSSLITDNYVPLSSQLSTTDKLKVVDLLIKLTNMKQEAMNHPEDIVIKDFEKEVKDLSVDSIKKLLEQKNSNEKDKIINEMDTNNMFSMEEKAYLETLSVKELLQLLEETNKGGK